MIGLNHILLIVPNIAKLIVNFLDHVQRLLAFHRVQFLVPYYFLFTLTIFPAVWKMPIVTFADDTQIGVAGKDPKSIIKTLNSDLANISDWMAANKLSLNKSKTEY